MNDLTVISVVENDSGLLEYMVRSVIKYTPTTPQFIICDNTNGKNIKKINSLSQNIQVVKNSPSLKGGSNRHGSGLNKIMPMVKTKKVAIIESDVAVLNENWYNICNGRKVMVASKSPGTYHICFLVAETKCVQEIDFMPANPSNNKSYGPATDVGFRLGHHIKPTDICRIDFVDCKSGNGNIFGPSFQSDEFQHQGITLAAHFGRGSNIGGKTRRKGFGSHKEQLKSWKEILNERLEYK